MTQELTPIEPTEREPDNNIVPVARERAIDEIEKLIARDGCYSIKEIAEGLKVGRTEARRLVLEIAKEWKGEIDTASIVIIKYYESILRDLTKNAVDYGLITKHDIMLARISILNRILLVKMQMDGPISRTQLPLEDDIFVTIFGRIKSRFDERQKVTEPQDDKGMDDSEG